MPAMIASGCTARIGVLCCVGECIVYAAFNNLAIHNVSSNRTRLVPASSPICTVCASQSNVVLAGCQDGQGLLVDVGVDGRGVLKVHRVPSAISFSCSLDGLFVFGCIDGGVHSVSLESDAPRGVLNVAAPKKITALGLIKVDGGAMILMVATSDLALSLYHLVDGHVCSPLVSLHDHHANWINTISSSPRSNRFMTCGQDRHTRIWSIKGRRLETQAGLVQELVAANKTFALAGQEYAVDTEAILVGHDDAVLSGRFLEDQDGKGATVLTSSSDRTVIRWVEGEEVWQSSLQVGDVAGMGTAGSGDLFDVDCIDGQIIAHNTNGSVVSWAPPEYRPRVVCSGHFNAVSDVAFSPSGAYLLTCSVDFTTRAWVPDSEHRLVEVARPQVHGYELKSVACLSDSRFVSAGDEKVVRVFQATRSFAARLQALTGCQLADVASEGAVAQPALGLSNKPSPSDCLSDGDHSQHHLTRLPTDNELSSSTLFPELDKLYGHGDELQCVAASSDGRFIASAARATLNGDSSIRIWDAASHQTVHVLRPHALTVVQLQFSPDCQHLLSVGRDRRFAVIEVASGGVVWVREEAHGRIVWDGTWLTNELIATGSRDKLVKIWNIHERSLLHTLPFDEPVTAVCAAGKVLLAGTETGTVFGVSCVDFDDARTIVFKANGRINRIAHHAGKGLVALACADHSLVLIKNK